MSKSRILVIDDDELVSKTVKNLLTRQGYEVSTAHNAIEAVSLVAVQVFDLVISDIRMPGDNGIIAIEKIQKIYSEKKIHCGYLLITGYTEEDTPAHAIRLGINKFLFKPFDNEKILKDIQEELELVQKEKALKEGTASAQPKTKTSKRDREYSRRAVITGIGCVAPNGIGKEAYWNGLLAGTNCVDEITFFDASTFPARYAAEIRNFDPRAFIEEYSEVKRMGRSSHLAVAGAKLSLQDAGLTKEDLPPDTPVIFGSAISGLEYVETDFRALERGGVKRVRPFLGIAGFAGAISSEISRALGIRGHSVTISTGCTSSTDAIGYALGAIREGKSDLIISGGADACVASGILAAFCQMGAVSFRNDKKASRPFNQDRGGFVISEGSWVFVVEELQHALARKATIYGEIVGYGSTCDAWHMAKPHPSGEYTAQAIRMALDDGNVAPEQIDLFETYGNGTPVNDSYETGVIKKVFGKHAYSLLAPSIKSMIGHPLGAAGSQQVAAALGAFKLGRVHPTINYEIPDPECDLNYVPNVAVEKNVKAAVCSSIAFGAKNSALVLKKI